MTNQDINHISDVITMNGLQHMVTTLPMKSRRMVCGIIREGADIHALIPSLGITVEQYCVLSLVDSSVSAADRQQQITSGPMNR